MKTLHTRLLFIPLLFAVGCAPADKADESGSETFSIPEPVEPVVLSADVKVMPDTTEGFNGLNPQMMEAPNEIDVDMLENASFIVGRTADGQGYLRKVKGTRTVDGRPVADLEEATLDEVIESGDWKYEMPEATEAEIEAAPFATEDDLAVDASPNPEGLNLLKTYTKSAVFKFNLGGKSITSPNTAGGTFSVAIEEGTLTYSPSITIGGQHRKGKITQFSFLSKGSMRVRMKISASLSKGASKGGSVALFPAVKHPFAFTIGAVPVAGTVTFDVNGGLSINSSISGKLTTLVDCTFPITAGGQFNNGVWTKTASPQVTCTSSPVTASANGSAGVKVSVTPELAVRLYGVVGPAVDLEPYLKATTSFTPSPKKCDYSLSAGVSSSFSVAAKLFKWTATAYSTSLFDKSNVLRSGSYCN